MPLKHLTETVLIVLLAIATIATGVVVSTLPHLPEGFFPWSLVLLATILYPAIFYPLFKNNRADYAFRALHFAPVALTLLWMFIEIALLKDPRFSVVHNIYAWGWSAIAVSVVFLFLGIFCLQVIRRRIPRLALLVLLLAPFIAVAYVSEKRMQWHPRLAALLWGEENVQIAQQNGAASSGLAPSSRGEKNLSTSSVSEEEAWRQKLREVEQGTVHSVTGPKTGVDAVGSLLGQMSSAVTPPKSKLTKSGGEFEALLIVFIAAYAGTLHRKSKQRMV